MRPVHVILLGTAVAFSLGVVPANAAHTIGPGPEVFYLFDMGPMVRGGAPCAGATRGSCSWD